MKPRKAKSVFKNHLRNLGHRWKRMSPAQGIDAMVSFYLSERADGCSEDDNGDMLLFQWGSYDWGKGEFFELDITRQLIFGGDDDENIWQLSFTFRYVPTEDTGEVEAGTKWCKSVADVPELSEFIHQSTPFQLLGNETPHKVEIGFECAG